MRVRVRGGIGTVSLGARLAKLGGWEILLALGCDALVVQLLLPRHLMRRRERKGLEGRGRR